MLSAFKFSVSFDCCLAEMSEHCLIFLSEVSFGFVRCHRKTEPKKPTFSVSVFGFLEDRSVLYIREPNFTQTEKTVPNRTEKPNAPVLTLPLLSRETQGRRHPGCSPATSSRMALSITSCSTRAPPRPPRHSPAPARARSPAAAWPQLTAAGRRPAVTASKHRLHHPRPSLPHLDTQKLDPNPRTLYLSGGLTFSARPRTETRS